MLKNFTKVYYSKVNDIDLEKVIPLLPKIRVEKINRLQNEQAKKLSAGVHLLLISSLREHGIKAEDYEYKYDENGKPFLEGLPLHFSLSHSGDFVAVAISDKPVGIDIQEMNEINLDLRKFIFTEKEEKEFKNNENKLLYFYEKWTSKEAKFKLDGTPLKTDCDKSCHNIKVNEKIMIAVTPNKPTEIKEI